MSASPTSTGTIIITGAAGALGLGFASAALKTHPEYTYVFIVRSTANRNSSLSKLYNLLAAHPNVSAEVISCDLTLLSEVRGVAADINSKISNGTYPPLRSFIANAYAWNLTKDTYATTIDGIERDFSATYLGHWLFINLLLSKAKLTEGETSVVLLGSIMHDPKTALSNGIVFNVAPFFPDNIDDFFTSTGEKGRTRWTKDGNVDWYSYGFQRYADGKMCALASGEELKRRVAKDPRLAHVRVRSYDPQGLTTGFYSSNFHGAATLKYKMIKYIAWMLSPVLAVLPIPAWKTGLNNVSDAGLQLLDVAVHERFRGKEGYVIADKPEFGEQGDITRDEEGARRLWEASRRWARVEETEVEGVLL
ncbi:hypothetical protein BJ508DRAFT_358577 [Ascobolus immersus RN42]|uniref:Uncharacterized protein n=1 Tax=Ascobolus immersus RN42 TaxID=1160509 RepID=A0A3N4IJR9_ASCIM|nr:hypothetical protein BJ508DRAFT_358577 [Ascobolus immersus RN42]